MMKYTDKEIVKHLKKRKGSAVKYLYDKFLPIVKYIAKNTKINKADIYVIGDEEDAQNVFNEALLVIIRKIDEDKLNLEVKFSTFFYAVCRNILNSKLKRRIVAMSYKLTQSIVMEEAEVNISENYDRDIQKEALDYYFKKLSKSCQKILRLYWLEIPVKEIAKKTGFTEKYIRKRKYICKNKLIKLIIENPDKF